MRKRTVEPKFPRYPILATTLFVVLLAVAAFASAGASAREVTLPHRGITLNGTLDLADGKSTGDGVILMVHGTMAHKDMEIMRQFRAMFRKSGYSTLALNLGLGVNNRRDFYDCAHPNVHRLGDALAEIGAWLDWLQANGAQRVVLFGFSRGGQQAAWFAAERDHAALASLVLLAPINPIEVAQASRFERQFSKSLQPLLEQAHSLVKAGKGQSRLEKVPFLNCPATTVTAESFLSYYAPGPQTEMPALLKRVKKPALVVVAGNDQIVHGLDQIIAPLVDGKRLRMTLIPGADHFFRDLYGEDAMEEIVKFLRP